MNKKILTVLIIVSLMAIMLSLPSNTHNTLNMPDSSSASLFSITEPPYVYNNQSFNINVTGIPGYHNYSVIAYFGAVNDTGLSPLSYYKTYAHNYNFTIPMIAPAESEEIYGYIDTSAVNSSSTFYDNFTIMPINVSAPVIFSTTVKNSDPVAIYNTTLTYTVTNAKGPVVVGISHIDKISANSTYKDNITVPLATVPKGRDTLTITSNNPVITITGNSSVVFYNGIPPNYNWIYYIAAVVVAFAIFLIVASGKRNVVKVPKWKRAGKKPKTVKAK
ncbi:MAG: hypothetical protein QXZ44_04465 [Ferroplasma sp.]